MTAHYLAGRSLEDLKNYLGLEALAEPLSKCAIDLKNTWKSIFPTPETPPSQETQT
jgi:hypothetical protein